MRGKQKDPCWWQDLRSRPRCPRTLENGLPTGGQIQDPPYRPRHGERCGLVEMKILVDDKEVFTTGKIPNASSYQTKALDIPLTNAQKIYPDRHRWWQWWGRRSRQLGGCLFDKVIQNNRMNMMIPDLKKLARLLTCYYGHRACVELLLLPPRLAPDSKAKPNQPNIVIYMIDDLGWNQISAAKATMGTHTAEFQTPHLEKLAKNGLSFTHAYMQPNCAPSRAAVLSGQYPARVNNGVYVVGNLNRNKAPGISKQAGKIQRSRAESRMLRLRGSPLLRR